ncbi:MAG: hypothetical protein HYR62_08980 [Actinobacteria bacterium]|nr:hypothetical protein [Actinomycetota bacterium]MBI3688575.1 hypothetical protein [Actinomycetota bacterium]
MTPLVWLAMPVVATALATGWAGWVSRDRAAVDAYESVQAHRRFVDALSHNVRVIDAEPASASDPQGRDGPRE